MCVALDSIFCYKEKKEIEEIKKLITLKDEQINSLLKSLSESEVALALKIDQTQGCEYRLGQLKSSADSDRQALLTKIDDQNKQLQELSKTLIEKQNALNDYIQTQPVDSIYKLLPPPSVEKIESYWVKYTPATLTYSGRTWGKNQKRYPLDVRAFLLEGQNDSVIYERVKKANAFVADIMKEQPTISAHRACDISIMRISNSFNKTYLYDIDSFGIDEFWQFASEMENGDGGDCDDQAIYRYVGCIVAGIPEKMLRVTAGMTYGGGGHATNYYFASDLRWHHVNSTSYFAATDDVLRTKNTGDSSDLLGIQFPWFSMTHTRSFQQFGTEAHKEAMKILPDSKPFFKYLQKVI